MLVQTDDEVRAMVQALATHEVSIGADTVPVIFDAQYDRALEFADSAGPVLTIQSADWPAVARGSSVTVASTAYTVIGIEPDGAGITRLRLQRA
ncbi:MAG TPA: hypothetical protein PLV92_14605 [Pirellulaceae bacterium]|nr:hypothetical protein [Pirellulaceae bacterium]